MEAIILAGGLGSRLRSVVSDTPKPLAPINDKPFLEYLLEYLQKQSIEKVVLSVGYKHEMIKEYFGNTFNDMSISYAIEEKRLGTGGGLRLALNMVSSKDLFVLNGDSFFGVDFNRLIKKHMQHRSDITLSLKQMQDFDRYGSVQLDNDRITQFNEKQYTADGFINGGVYALRSDIFDNFQIPDPFSFEEFLEGHVNDLNVMAFKSTGYFIDIGSPDDYQRAQTELRKKV